MAKNNPNIRKGICINFGNCSKADSHEIQEISLDNEFICQNEDCEQPLDVYVEPTFPWKKILITTGIVAVLGICVYFGYPVMKDILKKEPPPEHIILVEEITLNITSLSFVNEGASKRLTATVYPPNVAEENKKITWESENDGVATVDTTGFVRAISKGETVISARIGDVSATCYVTVEAVSENPIVEDTKKADKMNPEQQKKLTEQSVYSCTISVSGGTYTGECKNGKPHKMGTIRYNSRTLINPNDPKEKQRYAEAGQRITGEFYDGRLVHGQLFDSNGNQIDKIVVGRGAH